MQEPIHSWQQVLGFMLLGDVPWCSVQLDGALKCLLVFHDACSLVFYGAPVVPFIFTTLYPFGTFPVCFAVVMKE